MLRTAEQLGIRPAENRGSLATARHANAYSASPPTALAREPSSARDRRAAARSDLPRRGREGRRRPARPADAGLPGRRRLARLHDQVAAPHRPPDPQRRHARQHRLLGQGRRPADRAHRGARRAPRPPRRPGRPEPRRHLRPRHGGPPPRPGLRDHHARVAAHRPASTSTRSCRCTSAPSARSARSGAKGLFSLGCLHGECCEDFCGDLQAAVPRGRRLPVDLLEERRRRPLARLPRRGRRPHRGQRQPHRHGRQPGRLPRDRHGLERFRREERKRAAAGVIPPLRTVRAA